MTEIAGIDFSICAINEIQNQDKQNTTSYLSNHFERYIETMMGVVEAMDLYIKGLNFIIKKINLATNELEKIKTPIKDILTAGHKEEFDANLAFLDHMSNLNNAIEILLRELYKMDSNRLASDFCNLFVDIQYSLLLFALNRDVIYKDRAMNVTTYVLRILEHSKARYQTHQDKIKNNLDSGVYLKQGSNDAYGSKNINNKKIECTI